MNLFIFLKTGKEKEYLCKSPVMRHRWVRGNKKGLQAGACSPERR